MIETALAIIAIVIIFIYIHPEWQKSPPGAWNLPILGCLHKINNKVPNMMFTQLGQKYGPFYSLKLGLTNVVVISDGTLLRKILVRHESFERPPLYTFDTIFQNKGITYSPHSLWKHQRRFVSKFLKSSCSTKIPSTKKTFENHMKESAEKCVQDVRSRGNRVTLDPSETITWYVSNILGLVLLGTPECDDTFVKKLASNFDKLVAQTTFNLQLNFLPFLHFLPKHREAIKSLKELMGTIHSTIGEIINRDLKFVDENSTMSLTDAFLLEKFKCTSEEIYNVDQLQHLLSDMFGAGIITTASSIMWNLLYLAQYQEVQNNVRKELSDVLQGKTPQIDVLPKLPYTQATIAEVARIRTLLPLGFPRYLSNDISFQNCRIKKSTMIIPLLSAIHMDPKVFKMPENFCPDRFLNDEGEFYQPEAFLPYQAGGRMCVGKDLANMMIFLFVATVLQNFKIESLNSDSVDLSYDEGLMTLPKPQKLVFKKL